MEAEEQRAVAERRVDQLKKDHEVTLQSSLFQVQQDLERVRIFPFLARPASPAFLPPELWFL